MLPTAAELDATVARARATVEAWQTGPAVGRVAAAFAGCAPLAIEPVADAATALLSDATWIAPMLAPLIVALAADPWFAPPLRITRDRLRTTVQLLDLPAGTLGATIFDGGALAAGAPDATLVASGRLVVARYHAAGGARMLRWEAGGVGADFRAATAPPLRPLAPVALRDGDVLRIDGRTRAHLVEGGGADVVALTFTTRAAGLTREYDRATGRILRAATSDDAVSRTRLLLALLRVDGRRDAGACFAAATRAPAFHLRWAAVREWLALDAPAALPRLRELAADDPHPEVRAVAQATLPLVEARLCRG
jgi:hypothetical protein